MEISSARKTLGYLRKVALPLFVRSSEKWRAYRFVFTLLLLSAAISGVQVLMSYASRDMMTALEKRQSTDFYKYLAHYLLTIGVAIPFGVLFRYCEERFALLWREWLTNHLLKRYFFRRAYYYLRGEEALDNPDQRIAEDTRNFTATTLSLSLIFLNSTITLFAFLGVLCSISWTLVGVLLAYALGGTLLSLLIGYRLIGIHYEQYQKEADLRYGLVRIRDNAESIAFFRGEARERVDLMQRLGRLVENTFTLIGWNRNLAFFTSGYNYVALVVPVIVVAPLFLEGKIEFGVITQATGAFAQVLAAVSLIITQFERLSAYAAGVTRLGALWDAIAGDDPSEDDDPEINVAEGKILSLDKLTVRPPKSERRLVEALSLQLPRGKGLLIMGPSGSGKSSILRTVAGLWNTGDGAIQRPQLKKMMFLPQKPYLIQASLRANMLYPQRDGDVPNETLEKAFREVNLESLTERVSADFQTTLDWSNILSLGEQQRLSFARVLLYKPDLVFLDEASSALDEANEKSLYELLRSLKCSYVSIGHRSTLRDYHDLLLLVKGDGDWELTACTPASPKADVE